MSPHRANERRHALVVLYSTLADTDWPDQLDLDLGRFTYYGDNKHPGHELHQTHRGGNRLLRQAFDATHATPPRRDEIPPFFVFTKGALGRDVVFRGLAVPGAAELSPTDDLVAIWRTTADQRFQNYRATFTLLDTGAVITRNWINDLITGAPDSGARAGRLARLDHPRPLPATTRSTHAPVPNRRRPTTADARRRSDHRRHPTPLRRPARIRSLRRGHLADVRAHQ